MFKKVKSKSLVTELFISLEDYSKILRWSQSKREINFICFGYGNIIEDTHRLSNISRLPENFSLWSENERNYLIKEKKKSGQIIIANGHSHPKKYHDNHPSITDVKYIDNGTIELIAFPLLGEVKAWRISNTLRCTLNNEINIIIF